MSDAFLPAFLCIQHLLGHGVFVILTIVSPCLAHTKVLQSHRNMWGRLGFFSEKLLQKKTFLTRPRYMRPLGVHSSVEPADPRFSIGSKRFRALPILCNFLGFYPNFRDRVTRIFEDFCRMCMDFTWILPTLVRYHEK